MWTRMNIVTLLFVFLCAESAVGMAKDSNSREACPEICEPEKCPNLGPIMLSNCPEIYIVTDRCDCCKRCNVKHVTTPVAADKRDEVCKKMTCPKKKVCVLNIQGLPVCKCPTEELCRKFASLSTGKKTRVCGTDGVTYHSRCHLKVSSCDSDGKIRVSTKGECSTSRLQNQLVTRPITTAIVSPRRQENRRQGMGHDSSRSKHGRRGDRKQQRKIKKREKNYQRAIRTGRAHST